MTTIALAPILQSTLVIQSALLAQSDPEIRGETTEASASLVPEDSSAALELLSVEPWIENAARPAWSPKGDWIAFDRRSSDDRYDVYAFDVVSRSERCLTCEMYDLRKANSYNATWHPSGDYLIVQVQKFPLRLGIKPATLATPDRAVHSDLYLVRFDRKDFWQLTQSGELGSAVLDAHFSYDGDRVVWTERIGTRKGRYGTWRLRTGTLQLKRGVPRLVKVKGFEDGEPGLRVAHEFTPDDQSILLSGNLESGQAESGQDVYIFDTRTGESQKLTNSRAQNDEFAHISPRGDHIVWTTNQGLFPREPPRWLEPNLLRDLWIMERDGSNPRRLTHFNSPDSAHSLGEAYVGDFAWSPDGNVIAVHVIEQVAGEAKESIYRLRLPEEFRRP